MGCCISTTKPTKSGNPNVTPSKCHRQLESDVKGRSPPPPPVIDEETVKEVLSETPIYKPPSPTTKKPIEAAASAMNSPNTTQRPEILQEEVKTIEQIDLIKPSEEEITIVSEISEASEMCSFSGSCSTTALNDRDEGEVTQRVGPRSPAKKTPEKRPYSGEMPKDRGLRSPAMRSSPSPVKRSQVRSGPAQGRTTAVQRRNAGPINGTRRDPGQRSRPPAPRRNVGYKPPASSTTGQSGYRLPARKVEEGGKLEKENDGVSADTSESFENPHVALECFIFL